MIVPVCVAAFGSRSTISGWAAISPSPKSSRFARHRVRRRLDYPAPLRLDHLNYGLADSQVTRYLLHLLVTTVRDSDAMRRAVLLAAPRSWFEREAARGERSKWRYFLDHYTGLAQQFDVALGAIMIEQLPLLT